MQGKDHEGVVAPIRCLIDEPDCKVLLFHESLAALQQILEFSGSLKGYTLAFSWSWYLDDRKALEVREFLAGLKTKFPSESQRIDSNAVFLMNSASEFERMKFIVPAATTVHVNNTCFLSERPYHIVPETTLYDAVMNAKPLLFKRHYLTASVPRKLFISYGNDRFKKDRDYVDIMQFSPAEVVRDVSENAVAKCLNQSVCGLILSDIEGACYASTEYLMCGIPVVSTVSLGGRDEYFDATNSVVVAPQADQVADAVAGWCRLAAAGDIDRKAIREGTIRRIKEFRLRFAAALSRSTGKPVAELSEVIDKAVWSSNKLWNFKNFWIKAITA